MNQEAPALSIVIPAFNEEKALPVCLRHVRASCDACPELVRNYEIIVCDNNSTDRTGAIAREWGCEVVFEPLNQIARARNRGASIARAHWLLFVDADSWPSAPLMADAMRIAADERYIGCGSTIRIVDGPSWFKFAWESKNLSMRLLKWCPGGFIMTRRQAFEKIGGFPTDRYIFEEAEFVKQLKKLGTRQNKKFAILHRHPFSASGRKGKKYGFVSWSKTAFRFWLSGGALARDKSFAEKWYEGDR